MAIFSSPHASSVQVSTGINNKAGAEQTGNSVPWLGRLMVSLPAGFLFNLVSPVLKYVTGEVTRDRQVTNKNVSNHFEHCDDFKPCDGFECCDVLVVRYGGFERCDGEDRRYRSPA